MCDWGAPSGVFGAFDDIVRELRHTGWGSGVGGLGAGTRINGELVQPAISAGGLLIVQRLDASLEKAGSDMRRTFKLWKGKRSR